MIKFRHVSKIYETGTRALKDLSLTVNDGEFVFIAGKSGSGKSTVIKLVTGELAPTDGLIEVNGTFLHRLKKREIPIYRRTLGVVFQDFRLLNDRNIYENIAFAQRVIGTPAAQTRKNVTRMLRLTGLSAKYKAMPYELSGGEQQKTAIARALVNNPEIILADEPTGNLDETGSMEIMKLLLEINRMGTTVVVVTHSEKLIRELGKRVIVLDKGMIVDDIPAKTQERKEM